MPEVRLILTEKEASVLLKVCRNIAGSPTLSARECTDSIGKKLVAKGVQPYGDLTGVITFQNEGPTEDAEEAKTPEKKAPISEKEAAVHNYFDMYEKEYGPDHTVALHHRMGIEYMKRYYFHDAESIRIAEEHVTREFGYIPEGPNDNVTFRPEFAKNKEAFEKVKETGMNVQRCIKPPKIKKVSATTVAVDDDDEEDL